MKNLKDPTLNSGYGFIQLKNPEEQARLLSAHPTMKVLGRTCTLEPAHSKAKVVHANSPQENIHNPLQSVPLIPHPPYPRESKSGNASAGAPKVNITINNNQPPQNTNQVPLSQVNFQNTQASAG